MLYDPSYVYLISSLNIAQGVGAAHIDHPGSTVQLVGAVVVRSMYSAFGNSDNIVESVFTTPESYLSSIYFALILINAIGLFAMGCILKNEGLMTLEVLFLQISPLLCFASFTRLTQVSSEIFLIFTSSLMIGFLFRYRNLEPLSRASFRYPIIFGILCGLSVVTKLTTIPFMLLPFLLLKGISRKLVLVIVATATFLVVFLIASDNSSFFLDYVTNTLTKTQNYGQGESGFADPASYTRNIIKMFSTDFLFSFVLGSSILVILYFTFSKKSEAVPVNGFDKSFILIFILSSLLLTALVAKNFFPHYTLPALLYANTALIFCMSMFTNTVVYKKYYRLFLVFLLLSSSLIVLLVYRSMMIQSEIKLSASREITSFMDQLDGLIILSFGVSSPELAIAYGIEYGGAKRTEYTDILSIEESSPLYYQIHGNKFRKLYFPFTSIEDNELKSVLSSQEKIYFFSRKYVARFDNNEAFLKLLMEKLQVKDCRLIPLLQNKNHESVFEVVIEE